MKKITVNVLNKSIDLLCKEEEQETLKKSVEKVNEGLQSVSQKLPPSTPVFTIMLIYMLQNNHSMATVQGENEDLYNTLNSITMKLENTASTLKNTHNN